MKLNLFRAAEPIAEVLLPTFRKEIRPTLFSRCSDFKRISIGRYCERILWGRTNLESIIPRGSEFGNGLFSVVFCRVSKLCK